MDEKVEITSLCEVTGSQRMRRLADIRNHQITAPNINKDEPSQFENRSHLFKKDGPIDIGEIGVWRWTATSSMNDPEKDYIEAYFQSSIRPVWVLIIKKVVTDDELKTMIVQGIETKYVRCDTLFAYETTKGIYRGVLCKKSQLIYRLESITISENVLSLPIYSFPKNEVFEIEKNLCFLKSIVVSSEKDFLMIHSISDALKILFLERITWPKYRESIGGTKAEWSCCKLLLEKVCDESFYDVVKNQLHCSEMEARQYVQNFVQQANEIISRGDIDEKILSRIVMNHDELRSHCESVGKEHWALDHQSEMKLAQAKIEEAEKKAMEINDDIHKQVILFKQEKNNLELEKEHLEYEILSSQENLNELKNKIKENEDLAEEVVKAIKRKIEDAQNEMEIFIADVSFFSAVMKEQREVEEKGQSINRWRFSTGQIYDEIFEEDVYECRGWGDTLYTLKNNLRIAGVSKTEVGLLASFLYASYLNKTNLILVGPNAEQIAHALSISTTGNYAGMMECFGDRNPEAVSKVKESEDSVIIVRNPFHPDWISSINNDEIGFKVKHKMIIWIHPFVEDLVIEPKGLYNYVVPVFTDFFVVKDSSCEPMSAGVPAKKYDRFVAPEGITTDMKMIRKLEISKLLASRLKKLLADGKSMELEGNNLDMEYLFALLPLGYLLDQKEMIMERLEEDNISSTIKEMGRKLLGKEQ